MKKINSIGIEFVALLVLILIPFVSSYDIYGNGSDVQQNMCGDGFCQPTETVASCPVDCSSPNPLPSSSTTNPPTNTPPANQSFGVQNNPPLNQPTTNQSAAGNTTSVNQPASTGNLPAQNSFFAGTTFKIILVIIILIVLGLIAYLILRKKNKSPAVSS